MEAMGEDAEMEEVDVSKAVTDETGDSKAEERLDNVTHTTDQSLQDLGKALNGLLAKQQTVQKAQKQDRLTATLSQLTAVVKTLAQSQKQQEEFNAHLMKSLGFSDDVIKQNLPEPEKDVAKSRPTQSLDTAAVIQQVLEGVFKNMPQFTQTPEQRHPFNNKVIKSNGMQQIVAALDQASRS